MPSYLVETYLGRDQAGERVARERRVRSAAAERTEGSARVRFDRSIHVPEDETCLYLFDAPSVQAVTLVARRPGLDALRVVEAVTSGEEAP